MRRRFGPVAIVLIALIAIGLVAEIRSGDSRLLIPIVLAAVVFLLYKFPPSFLRRSSSSDSARYRQAAAKSRERYQHRTSATDANKRRQSTPFRVIEGNKKRDDEPPTYH